MGRAPTKPLPSIEDLHRLLDYDATTGVLTWQRQAGDDRRTLGFNNKCAGKIAGTLSKEKTELAYLAVGIDKRYYLAHRLAWKWMTGEDPDGQVDHIDGDRRNNRWSNLRVATHGENRANSAPRSRSGFKGVHFCALHKKWRAVVSFNHKINHVGYFSTPEFAAAARDVAAREIQGEFARTF